MTGIRLADDHIGGVPIDVTTTRRETIMIDMESSISLIERVLEDKAIQVVKKALYEYACTLRPPWEIFDEFLTVSTKEIVAEIEGPNNTPISTLLGGDGLISWELNSYQAESSYTAEQWSNILDRPIAAPSFEEAMGLWQDAVS